MRHVTLSLALLIGACGRSDDAGGFVGEAVTTTRIDSIPSLGGYLLVDTEQAGRQVMAGLTIKSLDQRGGAALSRTAVDSLDRFTRVALADSAPLMPGQSRTLQVTASGVTITKLSSAPAADRSAAWPATKPGATGATWMIKVDGVTDMLSPLRVAQLVAALRKAGR